MKKSISVIAIALVASISVFAQRPAGANREKFNSLTPEQQASIQAKRAEAKAKWETMTPTERQTAREQMIANGGNPNGGGRPGRNAEAFSKLSPEKQAEINAMKEKVKAMTPEERKAFFQNGGGGRPAGGGRPGRG